MDGQLSRFSDTSMMAKGQMASLPSALWPSLYTMRRPMNVVLLPFVTTLMEHVLW